MSDRKADLDAAIGPDAPMTTNAAGGKQSKIPFRLDLLPPTAVLIVARVLADGALKYGVDNWRKINSADHLNHAMMHIFGHLMGDGGETHMEHAACRILMALEMAHIETDPKTPLLRLQPNATRNN